MIPINCKECGVTICYKTTHGKSRPVKCKDCKLKYHLERHKKYYQKNKIVKS